MVSIAARICKLREKIPAVKNPKTETIIILSILVVFGYYYFKEFKKK